MEREKSRVAVVFRAGIGNSFFGAGWLWSLVEQEIDGQLPFIVTDLIGTSSINYFITMYTGGIAEKYAEVCETFRPHNLSRLRLTPFFFRQKALFSNEPLKAFVRRYLTLEICRRAVASPINQQIVMVDDSCIGDPDRRVVVCETHSPYLQAHPEKLPSILFAGSALQVMFPNEKIDGKFYSDCPFAGLAVYRVPKIRPRPDLVFLVGLNIGAALHIDMSLANWIERSGAFTAALVGDNERRMLAQYTQFNRTIKGLRRYRLEDIKEHTERIGAQARLLPPEYRDTLLAFIAKEHALLERSLDFLDEELDLVGKVYIETEIATNPTPIKEPDLRDFTNKQLEQLFIAGYRAGIEAFRKRKLLIDEVVEKKLALLKKEYH